MIKKFYTILILLIAFSVSNLQSQERYLDQMFGVVPQFDVHYASNITIITGTPTLDTLLCDVWTPLGDTETERPLMLVSHTGSFLPRIANGQATGDRKDSTVIEFAIRMTSRGYVVAVFENRLGWLPLAPDEDVRKGTLLQAAFRGIQDGRAAVRFFRKTVAEDGNPYGIDPEKIGVLGVGTGGYIAWGMGCLDDWNEVILPKFLDVNLNPTVDSNLLGNLYGTTNKPLCVANWPTYNSDIDFAFNAGGALGDDSWLDGAASEPNYSGVHCPTDVFAPFIQGPVFVPTTNEFVVNVTGTKAAVSIANSLGSNDVINGLGDGDDALSDLIERQKTINTTLWYGAMTNIGEDNFYAFQRPGVEGSPWDWWGYNDLLLVTAGTNLAFGCPPTPFGVDPCFNADSIHASGLITNPDMSAEKGRRYIDTIMMLILPRAYLALGLGDAITSTEDILDAGSIGLQVGPVPAESFVTFNTNNDYPIESVYVYNMDGKLVKAELDVNQNQYILQRNNLPKGFYVAQLRFEEGRVPVKIIIE